MSRQVSFTEHPLFTSTVLAFAVAFFWLTAALSGILDSDGSTSSISEIAELDVNEKSKARQRRQLAVIIPGAFFIGYLFFEHVYNGWYLTNWHGPYPCDTNTAILFFRSLPKEAWNQFLILAAIPVLLVSVYASLWALILFAFLCLIVAAHRSVAISNTLLVHLGKGLAWQPNAVCE